ncbi:S8 family serine peptidase [Sorangium sp. So ce118]
MLENRGLTEERRLTGRKLIALDPGRDRAATARTLSSFGLGVTSASELGGAVGEAAMRQSDVVVFDNLHTMLISQPSPQTASAVSALRDEGSILAVEDEGYVYAVGAPALGRALRDYLHGYREGVTGLAGRLLGGEAAAAIASGRRASAARRTGPGATLPAGLTRAAGRGACGERAAGPEGLDPAALGIDETRFTWGLQAIGADRSSFTGEGVRIAILDTGFDMIHPDFEQRRIVTHAVVEQEVDDWYGHGTHTAGTACGPVPSTVRFSISPRYGVAPKAELHVCKVLNNCGVGTDGTILAGINWALEQRCRIISLSLGSFSAQPLGVYEAAGRRALELNALIVAAAGNDSKRHQGLGPDPCLSPANAASILSVAALDPSLAVAYFSNGGKVDIAAPGTSVYSSYSCQSYRCLDGTSMATPHVAGVAALLMQAHPNATAGEIRTMLTSTARKLDAGPSDVGAGLVQAPI